MEKKSDDGYVLIGMSHEVCTEKQMSLHIGAGAMEHALERLHELIVTISQRDFIMDDKDVAMKVECISASQIEKKNIKTYLLRKSLNIHSERSFELLIQRYQKEVVRLMDDLFQDKFRKLLQQKVEVHEALLKDLDEILSHIEDRYNKYFNLEERVPGVYLVVSQNELKERMKAVKKSPGLTSFAPNFRWGSVAPFIKGGIATHDDDLLKMVFEAVHSFIRKDENVSYRQMIYMKALVRELEREVTKDTTDTQRTLSNTDLVKMLVYMNFNSSYVASYMIEEIVDTINALHEPHEKRERLAQYYKEYNQMQVKPGVALKPNCLSLKEQLNSWLEDEMNYVEQKQRLLSVVPVMRDDLIFPDEEKMHFAAPVEVVSLFMRACMDAKFILNRKKTPVLKSAAKFMRTIEQEELSYKSMRNCWYRVVEPGHREKLKSFLMEMYKVVHKY